MDRPSTSKARGVCRYYLEPRGCFNGSKCKFLHGDPEVVKTTPYDQAKTCKFFAQGFCKRGEKCWFRHVQPGTNSPDSSPDNEEELCGICLEPPVTFGLLAGCNHVFCVNCIRQWRDRSGKSPDLTATIKKCPLCRVPSKYITPSSIFHKHGTPAKEVSLKTYRESMARVPCKYFKESLAKGGEPKCPFGRDCFYQHLNADGTPHILKSRSSVRLRARDFARPDQDLLDNFLLGDLSRTLDAVRGEFMRITYDEGVLGAGATLEDILDGIDPTALGANQLPAPFGPEFRLPMAFRTNQMPQPTERGLLLLQDLVSSLRDMRDSPPATAGNSDVEEDPDDLPPPLEPIVNFEPVGPVSGVRIPIGPYANPGVSGSSDSIPALHNVSSSENEEGYSSTEEEEEEVEADRRAEVRMRRLLHFADHVSGPPGGFRPDEVSVSDSDEEGEEDKRDDGDTADANDDSPPFVTDGRGRVIQANDPTEERSLLSRVFSGLFGG